MPRKNVQVSAPGPVLPEVAPLGTDARAEVAKEMFPGISDTDATVIALSSQVVQVQEQLAQANARIDALKATMLKLVEYVMTNTPKPAPQVEAPAPTPTPTPEPVVEPLPKAKSFQDFARQATAVAKKVAKAQPKAQAVVPPSPQATAKVAATPPPPVAHALNVGPKVVATFDSFISKGLDFSPLKVEGIDQKLAQPSAAYLIAAVDAYLTQYQGSSAYVQKIAALKPAQRSIPQRRGVLNSMFSVYKQAQTKGR
jgi:hypothetical protein